MQDSEFVSRHSTERWKLLSFYASNPSFNAYLTGIMSQLNHQHKPNVLPEELSKNHSSKPQIRLGLINSCLFQSKATTRWHIATATPFHSSSRQAYKQKHTFNVIIFKKSEFRIERFTSTVLEINGPVVHSQEEYHDWWFSIVFSLNYMLHLQEYIGGTSHPQPPKKLLKESNG